MNRCLYKGVEKGVEEIIMAKKKTHQTTNPAERQHQQAAKANKSMRKAWALIYSEDPDERQRRLEDCDASYSPVKRDS